MPDSDFFQRIANISIDDRSIEKLADQYSVSREVILRKCLDLKLVDENYYTQKVKEWEDIAIQRPSRKSGGNPYRTKGAYLGNNYLSLVFSRYYQNKISVNQLADYLGVKAKNIPGYEALLFNNEVLA